MEFQPQGYTQDGVAIFGRDDQSMVKFFLHPRLKKYDSKSEGIPLYDNIEMIEVRQPGEKEPIVQAATAWHKARFPRQYEAFKKGMEDVATGTPLELLFPSEPSTILSLKAFNIYTIQQLASLTDTAKGNIPMGQSLVDRAKNYLATAAGGSQFHQMQREIDELKAQIADAQSNPPQTNKRGPGRPPKVAEGA